MSKMRTRDHTSEVAAKDLPDLCGASYLHCLSFPLALSSTAGDHHHIPVSGGGSAALHGIPGARGPPDPQARPLHPAPAQRGGHRGEGAEGAHKGAGEGGTGKQ